MLKCGELNESRQDQLVPDLRKHLSWYIQAVITECLRLDDSNISLCLTVLEVCEIMVPIRILLRAQL